MTDPIDKLKTGIGRRLSMEIDGKVKLDFNARGVRCRIAVPLTALGVAHD